jgi:diguanylate cyclase (GGDEF)-like protein
MPLHNAGPAPVELDRLARKWAYLVSMTSYIPLPHKEIERQLRELAHEVFAAAEAEPLDTDRAAAVGEQLVKLHCVGQSSLRCSIDVLTAGLLAEGLPGERVVRVVSAVACGYTESVRWQTVEQQDGLSQALLEAVRNAETSRRDSETRHDAAVTELSLLRSELSHQLLHDVLTALPNRQFFTTRLEQVLNTGSPTTVYQLEVNGLGAIHDGLGRQAGAGLLRIVADRLKGAMASRHAMVARFEEGRFAILVETSTPTLDPAPVIATIDAALAEPAYLDGHTVVLSATTGVVQSPPYGADPVALLHAANMALRKAKELGVGRWTRVVPDQDDWHELRLAATLPGAWRTGQVRVEFRPQVRLADGLPVRLDTRLRWEHAQLGPLPHERCVALAERTGFGTRLGWWLLDQAEAWLEDLPLTVAVPPSLATDPALLEAVRESGLPAERLQVSVPVPAPTVLEGLAAMGVGVAVHDWAGDVTCLSDAPVQAVRLAPHLVRRAAEPLIGRAVRDAIALAHEAGAVVVVDGICSGAEADWWRAAGADLATGPNAQKGTLQGH